MHWWYVRLLTSISNTSNKNWMSSRHFTPDFSAGTSWSVTNSDASRTLKLNGTNQHPIPHASWKYVVILKHFVLQLNILKWASPRVAAEHPKCKEHQLWCQGTVPSMDLIPLNETNPSQTARIPRLGQPGMLTAHWESKRNHYSGLVGKPWKHVTIGLGSVHRNVQEKQLEATAK